MSELQDKLNSLLSDPAGMAQVVQLAQQLSSTMEPSAAPTPQSGAPTPPPSPNPWATRAAGRPVTRTLTGFAEGTPGAWGGRFQFGRSLRKCSKSTGR